MLTRNDCVGKTAHAEGKEVYWRWSSLAFSERKIRYRGKEKMLLNTTVLFLNNSPHQAQILLSQEKVSRVNANCYLSERPLAMLLRDYLIKLRCEELFIGSSSSPWAVWLGEREMRRSIHDALLPDCGCNGTACSKDAAALTSLTWWTVNSSREPK